MYVSSFRHMWVFTTLSRAWLCRPHITIYVYSYHYIFVLIPLYMRPHTTICRHMWAFISRIAQSRAVVLTTHSMEEVLDLLALLVQKYNF
jgi:hypothetical protein